MLLFGGADKDSVLGDLWALELDGEPRWTRLDPQGPGPGPRYFPAMIYDALRDRVLLHGGGRDGTSLSDLWELSLDDLRWTAIPTGLYGLALERHGLVHDTTRDRLLVFGGWGLDGDVGFSTSGVFTLDPKAPRSWRFLDGNGFGPDSRIAPSWLYDMRRDRVMAFGGGGFVQYRNDLWSLDFVPREPARAWLIGASSTAEGRATIVWQLTNAWAADVERRPESGPWKNLGRIPADEDHRLTVVDTGLTPGSRYIYRMRPILDLAVPPTYDESPPEVSVTIPGGRVLRLLPARPNPARDGEVTLGIDLDDTVGAVLEIFDVHGRRLWSRALDGIPPGRRLIRPEVRLAAGLYFTRLSQGGARDAGKIVVVP
jgi:hypothetical protein